MELVQARAGKDQTERKPGTFLPGNVPPKTRMVGQTNKITADLKNGIMNAAAAHGSDGEGEGGLEGYLWLLAHKHPKCFSQLLGRVLPLTVNANVGVGTPGVNINIVSIESGDYLSQEDIDRLASPARALIEAEPACEPDADSGN